MEIGTNDLGSISPEIVASDIHDIVEYLHFSLGIKMVGVCLVIPRRVRELGLPDAGFNLLALKLNQYLSVLLDDTPFAFIWHHEELESLDRARWCSFESTWPIQGVPELSWCTFKGFASVVLEFFTGLWALNNLLCVFTVIM